KEGLSCACDTSVTGGGSTGLCAWEGCNDDSDCCSVAGDCGPGGSCVPDGFDNDTDGLIDEDCPIPCQGAVGADCGPALPSGTVGCFPDFVGSDADCASNGGATPVP